MIDPDSGDILWKEPSILIDVEKKNTAGGMLAGAKLELQDMSGQTIDAWTSDKTPHRIQGDKMAGKIKAGEQYQLVEISAPDGYEIAAPITFKVEERKVGTSDYIQTVTMIDELLAEKGNQSTGVLTALPPSPKNSGAAKTGDTSPLVIYLAGMIIAAGGMLKIVSKQRKIKKMKK